MKQQKVIANTNFIINRQTKPMTNNVLEITADVFNSRINMHSPFLFK